MSTEDLGIFKNLNKELLKRILIVVEMTWVLAMAILYSLFFGIFSQFFLVLLVSHLITIIGLPSIFSKLNTERQEQIFHFSGTDEREEGVNEINMWDRAVLGFYVVTNACVLVLLFVAIFL